MPATKQNHLKNLLVRKPTVTAITSVGSSTIDLWVSQSRFPAPLPTETVKIWRSDDVKKWIRDQAGQTNLTQDEPYYSDDQLLGIKEVSNETTLGRSTIRLWVKTRRFPAPIRCSSNLNLWRFGDIRLWAEDPAGYVATSQTEAQ